MKKFKFKINGNPYEVEITNVEDNTVQMSVNGTSYDVEIDRQITTQKTPKLIRPTNPTTPVSPVSGRAMPGGSKMTSPLPGTVIEIHVKPGDSIKQGQKLITLEAMKMENILYADRDGKIMTVNYSKGDTVKEGDILMMIGE